MRKLVWIPLLVILFPALAMAGAPNVDTADKPPSWYKVGTVMTWGVDFAGRQYDFVVTIRKLAPDVEFDYSMVGSSNKEGSVKIAEKALKDADKQNNMFSGGPLVLEDQTTIWVSQAVLNQYRVKKIDHRIDTGSGYEIFLPEEEDRTLKANVDGVEQEFTLLHLSGDGQHLWILDNLAAPLIFKMDLGWKIWLKEIKSAK